MQVDLIHSVGTDLTVVNAARVSFNKQSSYDFDWEKDDSVLPERDTKLINYLATHDHHSPFNHSFLTFRVKAPIFVARQLVKHKFMPWNEVSRRYVDDPPEFYFPEGWRERAENVKQGSNSANKWYSTIGQDVMTACLHKYIEMLELGVCPEQARMVLPQNTMTEWYWSGTLGAFLDMLKLRLDSHTQQETREVAQMVAEHVKQLFPVSYAAYLGDTK